MPHIEITRLDFGDPTLKALLIMDGSSTHTAPDTIELLNRHGIYHIILPSHTSSISQPLDVSFFKSAKQKQRTFYRSWTSWYDLELNESVPNIERIRNLSTFYQAANMAYHNTGIVSKGFKLSGIWPCNPELLLEHTQVMKDEQNRENIAGRSFILKYY